MVGEDVFVTTSTDEIMSIDGKTGHINWTYTPEVDFSQSTGVGGYGVSVNRGVAAENGKLFLLTFDDKLQAVSQKTGEKLWTSTVADASTGAYESMAPTAYDGKVYVGDSGSEDGVRGFVAAYDQKTGKKLWQFYTVPKAGTGWVPKGGGGGTIYMPPTIDPKSGILYVGTGNPAPVIVGAKRPGKNLYTDSLLALDANTGELLWYHQEQAHDLWDYDAESPVAPLQRRNRRAPPARRRRGGQERPALPARRENRQEPLPLGPVREARPHAADAEGHARVPRRGRRLAVLAARLQPRNAGGLRLRGQHLHDPQGRPRNDLNGEKEFGGDRVIPENEPKRPAPSPRSKRPPAKCSGSTTCRRRWTAARPRPRAASSSPATRRASSTPSTPRTATTSGRANLKLAFGTAPVVYEIDGTEYVLVTIGGAALTASEELGEIGARVVALKLGGKKLPPGPELKG